ncbi:MAG: bifunctional 5,10-methylenetetrahydrofolate dehydrogenase/5,10-methenyltetrahydrofolate cyclohydrolase [Candidatus Omnitrophica bacterium]|nr:bifunctional 5,10-methylenetetrahydrofolate dehydrogenase/5,10-methenyltetrahydrofolate cyclohydrolase [Candidatus Omnitrophota bacterium]
MAVVFDAHNKSEALIGRIKASLGPLPGLCLASVAIGIDTARDYRVSQEKTAGELNIEYRSIDLKSGISFQEFKSEIKKLNDDKSITGIILNKPFPERWVEEEAFSLVDEGKDVEGLHPINLGKLFRSNKNIFDELNLSPETILLSPTVRSILYILKLSNNVNLRGKRVTIVGFSSLIGKPLALLLANAFATVSITHIGTYESEDLEYYVRSADILVSAVGIPGLIKGDWVKDKAVIIDAGTRQKDGKLTGDIEFDKAKEKAAFITPVPGGVGKFTSLFLYYNLVVLQLRNDKSQ